MSRRGVDWKAAAVVAAAWGGLGLVATAGTYLLSHVEGPVVPLGTAVLRQMPRWLAWACLTPLVLWLGHRVPFDARPRWVPLLFHIVAGVLVASAHTIATGASFLVLFPDVAGGIGPGGFLLAFFGVQLHFAILGYGAVLGAGFTWDHHRRLRARELREARLETQLVAAQLRALQSRIHPHFLFNTLHAIGVLIEEDPDAARRVVSRLGDLLRLVLDRADAQEVSLEEELGLLEPYLEIERLRFQDRLEVAIEVEEGARGARVPSFILQPLVENAVRHGIERRSGAGRIEVRGRARGGRLELRVENASAPGPGGSRRTRAPPPAAWRDGIGLSTTRERLQKLYGDDHALEIDVEEGRTRVLLRLPLREATA